MIYQKYGSPVEITGYCGKHKAPWSRLKMVLVRVKYKDNGSEGYQFAVHLRADEGINEIDAVIAAAPKLTLDQDTLKKAIKDAH